jgi:type I restriction enzyme S subunit
MISGEWIMHSIYSGAAQRFIEVLAKSTTVAHINMSDIPDLPIVLPPLREQEVVLALVRQEVSRISTMKEKLTRQIGLLRDYRQALITAAVTGDLELPEVAA